MHVRIHYARALLLTKEGSNHNILVVHQQNISIYYPDLSSSKANKVSDACALRADLRVQFLVSESLLALPTGLPLKFLQLEVLLMSYRSEHARDTQ